MLLFLSGCAVKTWTVEGPSEASDGLKVKVGSDTWKYHPSDLHHHLIPIHIEVENLRDEPVSIRREEVYLVDDKGNQYNSLEPRDVAGVLRRSYGVGFSFGLGYWSAPVGLWWSPYYSPSARDEVYPDILNKAFTFGQVQPKNRLSGFVYFPKVPEDTKSLTLYVKSYKFQLKLKED